MPRPVHRDEARKFGYGVLSLIMLLIVSVVGAIVQTGGALPGKKYTYVEASFRNVGILKPGKEVKQDGLRIGQVSSIEYDHGLAIATLRLEGDHNVYRDARAHVGNTSALGRKFVGFDPGTPEAGELGDATIPLAQTSDSMSLEDALDALDPKTRTALASSLGELGGGLSGHGADLNKALKNAPELLEDIKTVAAAVTSGDAELPGLLASADRLAGRFEGREAQLAGLLKNAESTMSALGVDDGKPLAATVAELPPTLKEAKAALDDLNRPLKDARSALTTLRPSGPALGNSADDLRGFLRDAVGPLTKVPGVGEQAVPVLDDLTSTLADARPLVPRVAKALDSADALLFGLAPYAGDAGRFFSQHDLLSGTLGPGQHYFAAMLTGLGLFSAAGLPDPVATNEWYPEPGTAWNDSTVTGGNR